MMYGRDESVMCLTLATEKLTVMLSRRSSLRARVPATGGRLEGCHP
jgi:hypothetical protein